MTAFTTFTTEDEQRVRVLLNEEGAGGLSELRGFHARDPRRYAELVTEERVLERSIERMKTSVALGGEVVG